MLPEKRKVVWGLLVSVLALGLAGDVRAQISDQEPIRIRSQGPGGFDVFRYGLNSFDRTIPGARARAMGGAGLALDGGVEGCLGNPAGFSLLESPTLSASSRWRTGSSSATDSPADFPSPTGMDFDIRDYRPNLTNNYAYSDMAFGMPIIFLGRRAGLGIGYRRLIDFRNGAEERFLIDSPFGEADFGAGEQYRGSIDAISPSFALNLTPRVSLGATLNFMTGTIQDNGDQGVTVFGQVITSGSVFLEQEVNGTSLDLGARVALTPDLSVAGVLQTGHDLDFTGGEDSFQPLLDPTAIDPTPVILERELLDLSLGVPTMYGVGGAWTTLNDRLTLAADYWNRSWSEATYTRRAFETTTLFADSSNLTNVVTLITVAPGAGNVEKSAGFHDTHNFRIGGEWLIKGDGGEGLTIPLRIGFRSEPMTYANIDTTDFYVLVDQLNATAADETRTIADRQAEIAGLVDQIYQDGSLLLSGGDITASTFALGTGVKVDSFSFDFGLSFTSYEVTHLFLGAFNDFTRNFAVDTVTEDRSYTEMSFSASLRF